MRQTILVWVLAAAAGTATLMGETAPTSPAAGETVLASVRVAPETPHAETYRDTAYVWLGRTTLRLAIDLPPAPGHVLELAWGSKNDAREAVATINGKPVVVRGGGYDGFRPLRVAVPEGVSGARYEITLARGSGKPGFISAVRLLATDAADRPAPPREITLTAGPPANVEAFPEMRAIWDREPPVTAAPMPDAKRASAFRRAEANARLAAEGFFRCRRFVDGWLAQADAETGLIPRNLGSSRDIWNAQDAAADNYPFMVLTCAVTDRALFDGRMRDMLRTETRLTSRLGPLPDTYSFSKKGFASREPNLGAILFGASEYVKDGLLPLTEWLGPSLWSERMRAILDEMWKRAPVETPFGRIVSSSQEINGEMLQTLARVHWMTGDRKYLDWAVRLGDYYLLGDHHPTRDASSLRLRDHGCEIVSGLCELYVTCHFAAPEKKKAYEKPLHEMLDRILAIGRNAHGLFYNTVDPKSGSHDRGLADTWGYNLNGFYAVYLVDKTPAYREATRQALGCLNAHYRDYAWEGSSADGLADSIESALNLYNREPVASAAEWIDHEIRNMWAIQKADGVIEGWHGDGNFARTTIMVCLWKTQGLTVRPWRKDVRLGAVRDGNALRVSLAADEPWQGQLLFDVPRHRLGMRLPLDWPRINQFPEWFTVEAGKTYVVRDETTGRHTVHTGQALREGRVKIRCDLCIERRLSVTCSTS